MRPTGGGDDNEEEEEEIMTDTPGFPSRRSDASYRVKHFSLYLLQYFSVCGTIQLLSGFITNPFITNCNSLCAPQVSHSSDTGNNLPDAVATQKTEPLLDPIWSKKLIDTPTRLQWFSVSALQEFHHEEEGIELQMDRFLREKQI